MISEAPYLRVEGGRASHSWSIRVVRHGYGGLIGAGTEVVDGMQAGQSQGSWSHVGRCRRSSRVRTDKLMTPDHTAFKVRSSG